MRILPAVAFLLVACTASDKGDPESTTDSGLPTGTTDGTVSTYETTSDPTTDSTAPGIEGPIDVLFVIDDSGSMPPYQGDFAAAVDTLVDGLADHDPRFGVITTTSADLVGGNLLQADDLTTLRDRMQPGDGGADQEQGLRWAVDALADAAWRVDAHLLIIGLTDEEDCSHDGILDGEPGDQCYLQPDALTPVSDLVDGLEAARPSSSVHAFVAGSTTTTGCLGFPSARWAEAAALTGGASHPLCSTAFTLSFQDIVDSL